MPEAVEKPVKTGGGDSGLTVDAQDDDAEDSADDHDDHHDGSEVVTRGLEHLDGHSASEDQVDP